MQQQMIPQIRTLRLQAKNWKGTEQAIIDVIRGGGGVEEVRSILEMEQTVIVEAFQQMQAQVNKFLADQPCAPLNVQWDEQRGVYTLHVVVVGQSDNRIVVP